MSNTNTMTAKYTAVQIRANKVVQSIVVRESDFADLQVIARCEPRSVWSIENSEGLVVEVLK
jgi:hypothetical protein